MSEKMTKARLEFLTAVAANPTHFADYWPPARWALERGYATQIAGKFGGGRYEITDAGRKALTEAQP